MKRLRCITGLLVAAAIALPALAQDASTTTPASPAGEARVFNAPVATPMGQGWYGAASTTAQTAWMSRAEPWSNDLMQVQGVGRVASIASGAGMMAGTPATNRLVTGIAQWMVPQDNSMWEVRFTGLNAASPFNGAGVLQTIHGDTGRGTDRFPRTFAFVTIYGPVDVFRNGQRIAAGLPGHIMVTQGIRDPQTGSLLSMANVRQHDIQFHVTVEGQIPGQQHNSLYVFWPQATIDIRNLGQPVALLPEEIRTARSFFGITSTVAGFRGGLATAPLFLVSLRDRFLARSFPQISPGEVELRILNESQMPQGFFIQGPGGFEQRTRVLAPGEMEVLRLTLVTGTYRLASFTTATPQMSDLMHWDTIIVR